MPSHKSYRGIALAQAGRAAEARAALAELPEKSPERAAATIEVIAGLASSGWIGTAGELADELAGWIGRVGQACSRVWFLRRLAILEAIELGRADRWHARLGEQTEAVIACARAGDTTYLSITAGDLGAAGRLAEARQTMGAIKDSNSWIVTLREALLGGARPRIRLETLEGLLRGPATGQAAQGGRKDGLVAALALLEQAAEATAWPEIDAAVGMDPDRRRPGFLGGVRPLDTRLIRADLGRGRPVVLASADVSGPASALIVLGIGSAADGTERLQALAPVEDGQGGPAAREVELIIDGDTAHEANGPGPTYRLMRRIDYAWAQPPPPAERGVGSGSGAAPVELSRSNPTPPTAVRRLTEAARLRAGPSLTAAILATLPAGTPLALADGSGGGEWLEVHHQGGRAFVAARLTQPAGQPPEQVEGQPSVLDTATLRFGDRVVPLFGLSGVDGELARGLERFVAAQGGRVSCRRKDLVRYACRLGDKVDLAEAVLLNGAARTSPDAPESYRRREAEAREKARGVWGAD
jgi:endonuclease YncB( thermonuclease family)